MDTVEEGEGWVSARPSIKVSKVVPTEASKKAGETELVTWEAGEVGRAEGG